MKANTLRRTNKSEKCKRQSRDTEQASQTHAVPLLRFLFPFSRERKHTFSVFSTSHAANLARPMGRVRLPASRVMPARLTSPDVTTNDCAACLLALSSLSWSLPGKMRSLSSFCVRIRDKGSVEGQQVQNEKEYDVPLRTLTSEPPRSRISSGAITQPIFFFVRSTSYLNVVHPQEYLVRVSRRCGGSSCRRRGRCATFRSGRPGNARLNRRLALWCFWRLLGNLFQNSGMSTTSCDFFFPTRFLSTYLHLLKGDAADATDANSTNGFLNEAGLRHCVRHATIPSYIFTPGCWTILSLTAPVPPYL